MDTPFTGKGTSFLILKPATLKHCNFICDVRTSRTAKVLSKMKTYHLHFTFYIEFFYYILICHNFQSIFIVTYSHS